MYPHKDCIYQSGGVANLLTNDRGIHVQRYSVNDPVKMNLVTSGVQSASIFLHHSLALACTRQHNLSLAITIAPFPAGRPRLTGRLGLPMG